MRVNNDPHDGIIKDGNGVPAFGQYVDFTGFWFDDYVLTMDHHISEGLGGDGPSVRVKINGDDAQHFFASLEISSVFDKSIGCNPTKDVHRESYEVRNKS